MKLLKDGPMNSSHFVEDRSQLFEYWKTAPAIRTILDEDGSVVKFLNQEVRSMILNILCEGIEDETKTGEKKRRFALNARELQEYMNDRIDNTIKLSNIYFHLQKLEEHNLVQIVTTLKEGKHHVAYYGRTAKMFIFSNLTEERFIAIGHTLHSLISNLHPDWSRKQIYDILNDLRDYEKARHRTINAWVEENNELLAKLEVDIRDIYSILAFLSVSGSLGSKIFLKLADALQFSLLSE